MLPLIASLSLIFISLSLVDATPITRSTGKATLGFATRFSAEGPLNVVEKDRARAQAFKNVDHLGKRDGVSTSATNAIVNYVAEVSVGNPPTEYSLLIDTGSSNTWVGANKPYKPTSTSTDTGNTVSVSYGSGSFSGKEYIDTITLGSGLVITRQSVGVATTFIGMQNANGILGVGPIDLTVDTVSNTGTVPTVTDNLVSQGTISENVLGIYFDPVSESDTGLGELTFGGVDFSVTKGEVQYVLLTTTSPASNYWGIDQSISYGGKTILQTTAGIVDTGTTLILIATDAFNKYQSVTGGTPDSTTGLLKISLSQYMNLKTLTFNIGGKSYDLIPNAQIWPRSLNTAIGGNTESIYLIVGDIGSPSGSGLDFTNGYAFLERYYSVFDATNKRVGFAPTAYTKSIVN